MDAKPGRSHASEMVDEEHSRIQYKEQFSALSMIAEQVRGEESEVFNTAVQ